MAGTKNKLVTVDRTNEPMRAPDTRIKQFSDINDERLQALVQRAHDLGFTGTVSAAFEQVSFPGGSYPLATITFRGANGVSETYDLGLFLAYPDVTFAEMRRIHLLPVVGINFAKDPKPLPQD